MRPRPSPTSRAAQQQARRIHSLQQRSISTIPAYLLLLAERLVRRTFLPSVCVCVRVRYTTNQFQKGRKEEETMALATVLYTLLALACTPFVALLLWNYGVPVLFHAFANTVGTTMGAGVITGATGVRPIHHHAPPANPIATSNSRTSARQS